MASTPKSWTVAELAERVGGRATGDSARRIFRAAAAGSSDAQAIVFAASPPFMMAAQSGAPGCIVTSPELECDATLIIAENARAAFARIVQLFDEPLDLESGWHPTATVHPDADVHPDARLGPNVVVGPGSTVAEGARLHSQAYVGDRCSVGANSVLYPRSTLVRDVTLGANCIVHVGAVIGADGFGFEFHDGHWVKVPQIGRVIIGDDCEIGANTCVDRGALGDTVLGNGVKVDNLVQIAHNVEIGDHSVLTGMVGIGGSAKIGSRVILGASAGVRDHITIGDDVVVGGRAGVANDLTEPGEYWGTPAIPKRDAIRNMSVSTKLAEVWRRLREIEARLGPKPEEE